MTLFQKSLLATAVMVLALVQLLLIATARGWIGSSSGRTQRRALYLHRAGGYLGMAIILLIAYNCILKIHWIGNPYKPWHMLFGASATVLVLSKVSIARVFRGWRRRLPAVGLTLLAALAGAWTTSALWYLAEF